MEKEFLDLKEILHTKKIIVILKTHTERFLENKPC